jgi:hypothetical protein
VGMHAVERGMRRVHLVKVPEEGIDEVRKRFGNDHRFCGV